MAEGVPRTVGELKKVRKEIDNLDKGPTQANKELKKMGEQTRSNKKDTDEAGFSVLELAAKYYVVINSIKALVAAATPAYQLLIGQNQELQQQLIGIQSTLAATNQVIVGGVEIQDPTEAILALEGPVNQAIERIRKGSLELVGVTSNQLVDTFRIVATEAGGIGINLDEAADLSLDFAAALGTLGVPLNQAQQEIRSILQGTIDQNSIVAKSLGISNEQVRSLKEQGQLYEFLTGKLEAFRAGNALSAKTVGGITSNIQELAETIGRLAGEDLSDSLVLGLADVLNFLTENQEKILGFVKQVTDVFSGIVNVVVSGGEAIGEAFNGGDFLDKFAGGLFSLRDSSADLLDGLGDALISLARILGEAFILTAKVAAPLLAIVIRIVDVTLQAIENVELLSGAVRESTEAAQIYGEQTARAADLAIEALRKQKAGEEDAAAAKKAAIAGIDDQIQALKSADIAGAANRENIRNQIEELKRWKNQLQGTPQDVELVSKATQALDAELKQLEQSYKRVNDAAELENVKAQVAIYKELETGAISAEEATRRQAAAQQDNFTAQAKSLEKQITELQALQKKFEAKGATDRAKEVGDQIVELQTKVESTRLNATKGRIDEQNRLEKRALTELNQANADALKEIELAEQRRLNAISQTAQTEEQRGLAQLQNSRQTLQAQLEQARAREQELAQLKATGEEEKDLQRQRTDAALNTAKLTNQLLENERNVSQATLQVALQNIERQRRAQTNAANERLDALAEQEQATEQLSTTTKAALDAEITRQENIARNLQTQQNLIEAQQRVRASQLALQETRSQNEIDQLNRAIELRQRLNEEGLAPQVRRAIEQQLRVLGAANQTEEQLTKRRLDQENEIAQIRRRQFELELANERRTVEFAERRIELEVRLGEIKAQQAREQAAAEERLAQIAQARAQANLDNLRSQLGLAQQDLAAAQQSGTPEQVAAREQAVLDLQRNILNAGFDLEDAQTRLELARATQATTEATNAANLEELEAKRQINELEQQSLDAKQAQSKAEFDAAENARKLANELERAEAAARGINAPTPRAAGGPINRGQTYLVGERGPELFVSGVNGQIVSAAQLSQFFRAPQMQAAPASSSRGLEKQVQQLIDINRGLNAQILRLASRAPLQQQYNYYGSNSNSGPDLRGDNL